MPRLDELLARTRRNLTSRRSLEPVTKGQGRTRMPSGFATVRDILTFMAGMCVIGYEVFLKHGGVEAPVLAVGLTMTGLPLVFGADERRRDAPEAPPAPTPPTPPAPLPAPEAPAAPEPPEELDQGIL